MKRVTVLSLACLLVGVTAWADKEVDETRTVSPTARINIDIVAGSIRVAAWDRNEVRVTGTIGDDVDALAITGDADSMDIGLDVPRRWGSGRGDIDAHLEIFLPASTRLRAEAVSADIVVQGLHGTAELGSVSGNVEVGGRPSMAEVETVSGNIRVDGDQTAVEAETVSGDLDLRGIARTVRASSVSGDIDVSAGEIERGNLESVSGDLSFRGDLAVAARVRAETHSGRVTLQLPASTSATWEVETFSGNVQNEFGEDSRLTREAGEGTRVDFTTGSGDARITVSSFSGNIRLETR